MKIQTGGEEEGDLTQMAVIDRRVGLPLSKWSPTGVLREGHGVDFFSGLIGVLVSKSMFRLRRSELLPLGETGEGFEFTPSVRWTSPPNTTRKIWDAD